ncbi:hypothetical protein ACGFX2_15895 [Streptomyces goshikiensis]|uniref:hypothetical protein n=1 Tax=Streptomyces goshikiensis TaxID=1942 RepID=UPI00371CFFA0
MLARDSAQLPLPTRDQLCALRDFIHGRTYHAGSVAIRFREEPAPAAGSAMAEVPRVSQAVYDVTDHLVTRLFDELDAELPGPSTEATWNAILVIAAVWRDSPDMPEELRRLIGDAGPHRP